MLIPCFSYLLFISAIQQTPVVQQDVVGQPESMSTLVIAFTVLLCVACIFFIVFTVVLFRCKRRWEKAGETNVDRKSLRDSVITYHQVSANLNISCFLCLYRASRLLYGRGRAWWIVVLEGLDPEGELHTNYMKQVAVQ